MDLDEQVRVQDEAGIRIGLLSFSMQYELMSRMLFFVPESLLAERLNNRTAALVSRHPNKLSFMANVNPELTSSVRECERCIKTLGAKGVNISTSWKGRIIDSIKLDHFWEYAESENIAIFLHPPLLPIGFAQMNKYRLEETVGRPFETAMAVANLIYGGVFDRYPRLKVVLPHMGGGLPSVLGRLNFGYRLGYKGLPADQAGRCRHKPSEYLRNNLYADVMGLSPEGVRHAIEVFGADHLVFGSDYPAVNLSPKEHVDLVINLGLSDQETEMIFWKTANDLFHVFSNTVAI